LAAWTACGKVVSAAKFCSELDEFVADNCEAFSADDENKLEYTDIHVRYVEMAEKQLEAGLNEAMGPSFNMDGFLMQVEPFIDGGLQGIDDDDENSAQTLEVLTNFTDFEAFKQMMLVAKETKLAGDTPDRVPPKGVEDGVVTLDSELESVANMGNDDAEFEWKDIGGPKLVKKYGIKAERGEMLRLMRRWV
jgi:hypothetical protein